MQFGYVKTMNSVKDTAGLASEFAEILEKGDILLFTGEIGTGKTTFIQALAKRPCIFLIMMTR